jgi:hypothetical protein
MTVLTRWIFRHAIADFASWRFCNCPAVTAVQPRGLDVTCSDQSLPLIDRVTKSAARPLGGRGPARG